jgi:hypothetical protein
MDILLRPIMALCTILLLAVSPASAQTSATLSTADPQVCCSGVDAAGNTIFFLAPRSQCPKHKVVHIDRCKPQTQNPVCCKLPNGQFATVLPKRCKAAGGSPVNPRFCKQPPGGEVCCKTPNGYYKWSAAQCRKARGTVVNIRYCQQPEKRVCCKTRGGYSLLPASRCRPPAGAPVSARYCQQQPADKVCCKYTKADGSVGFAFLDPRRCKSVKGSQVPNRYCLNPKRDLRAR